MEIAQRAGVTWGAVQHHFGGKDGMLEAVLRDTFARFAARFENFPQGLPLRMRVRELLARAWEHFGSAHFRSTFEILLHHLSEQDALGADSPQRRMLASLDGLWLEVFGDVPLAGRDREVLQRYLVAVLSGLALLQVLSGRRLPPPREELRMLEDSLLREIRGARRRRGADAFSQTR